MPEHRIQFRPVADLKPNPKNARLHSEEQIEQVEASIRRFGWTNPVVADADLIDAGHGRHMAAQRIYAAGDRIYMAPGRERGGLQVPDGEVPVIDSTGWTEEEKRAYALTDNQLALNSTWDETILAGELTALRAMDFDIGIIGFNDDAIESFGLGVILPDEPPAPSRAGSLATEFLIPPFTVLNAREGWWTDRKRAWLSLGIKSEVGRGENLLQMSDTMLEPDPVKRAAMQASRADAAAFGSGAASADRLPGETTGDRIFRQGKARSLGQDILKGESDIKPERGGMPGTSAGYSEQGKGRKPGLGGVTMDALSSHPRYYEQKTAAEKKLGRVLSNEEFEADHWVLPDSDLSSGTSIFDPVLCELAYRWFSPPAGRVLDPFAGGSVRGIVAAALGRHYVGVDLREEQIAANRAQWPVVAAQLAPGASRAGGEEVPPLAIDEIEGIRVVRDDAVLGGTKRRALDRLIGQIEEGELVYASPVYGFAQIAIAGACRAAGKKATIFVAERTIRHPRTIAAAELGATIVEVKAGRLNVIQSRARKHCEASGAYLVPFGMAADMFVEAIAEIARELPGPAPEEIWCVAGSGTLTRALQIAFPDARHHAVQIGRDPDVGAAQLWKAPEEFEEDATLPPPFPSCSNYDAKAWRFIREHAAPGALFWNLGADPEPERTFDLAEPVWHTGDSNAVLGPDGDDAIGSDFDFVFSCPPYGDLEVYSDDPADISTLEMSAFDAVYGEIIAKAVARLADNRFACFVVGDYRDKRGIYANFISKTIAAFEAAGAPLYNEAILVTSVGSLPIRAAKQFRSTRKLGKTHQNVLVFIKGDPRKAVAVLGPVDVADALASVTPADDD